MPKSDAQELADRYVAVWNEPDAGVRRKLVSELWSPDGVHVLQAPQEMRKSAVELGFSDATLEARGHEELEVRVSRAYEDFVAPGEMVFRARRDAARLRNVVTFHWEALQRTGEVGAVGLEFLVLDEEDRITSDYQFIEI
ncbi:hypothetical protein QMK19_31975 [Streptomyces sp. H10-C2]|uniref:hypothetical protein n=1 Tax=unclassified Streptomyces TaxID=2593676 RepID=UPI0024BA09DA|nr:MULTISPECIES: hypothetical protein [unclassified Streptomyces]MDJ0345160.1 hypothetical protein [Streptomyces sp. PH10-H1]MDJ0374128.1 hypothetical protein [Streptomyces sp. H10-C2]